MHQFAIYVNVDINRVIKKDFEIKALRDPQEGEQIPTLQKEPCEPKGFVWVRANSKPAPKISEITFISKQTSLRIKRKKEREWEQMWGSNPAGLNGFRLPWVSGKGADDSTALDATAPWGGRKISCSCRVYFIQVHLVTATPGAGRNAWAVLVPFTASDPKRLSHQAERRTWS